MAVTKPSGPKDDALPFEGFLEALCRLSSIKALPTDDEVAEKGCADAGEYVLLMKADVHGRLEYEQMLTERRVGWGGLTIQPLERCVSHVLWIIVRAVEAECYKYAAKGADEAGNGELSPQEVKVWLKRCMMGEDKA